MLGPLSLAVVEWSGQCRAQRFAKAARVTTGRRGRAGWLRQASMERDAA